MFLKIFATDTHNAVINMIPLLRGLWVNDFLDYNTLYINIRVIGSFFQPLLVVGINILG